MTRLTLEKDKGSSIRMSRNDEIALGVPGRKRRHQMLPAMLMVLFEEWPPPEGATSALAVVSPSFSYVTRQTIEVDGGRQM